MPQHFHERIACVASQSWPRRRTEPSVRRASKALFRAAQLAELSWLLHRLARLESAMRNELGGGMRKLLSDQLRKMRHVTISYYIIFHDISIISCCFLLVTLALVCDPSYLQTYRKDDHSAASPASTLKSCKCACILKLAGLSYVMHSLHMFVKLT